MVAKWLLKTLESVIYIVQRMLYSLSNKVNWNFYDMVKIHPIMTNNVNTLTILESLL